MAHKNKYLPNLLVLQYHHFSLKQQEYNCVHGIIPQTIVKKISSALDEMTMKDEDKGRKNTNKVSHDDIERQIREYNKLMQNAAADLEFEKAIAYRDKIRELEKLYLH